MSQEQLALEAELDRTYISMLERALRQPSLAVLIAIARSLGLKAWQIVAEVEQELERRAAGGRSRQRRTGRQQPRRGKPGRLGATFLTTVSLGAASELAGWAQPWLPLFL